MFFMIYFKKCTSMGSFWSTLFVTIILLNISSSKELKVPVFLEPISNVTVPAGRDVRLACVVDHLGPFKVAWIQQDRSAILTVGKHVITRNPRIGVMHDEHRTWYLEMKDVRPGDAGTYMCQINTEPVTSQIGMVNVVVPPYIKDDMTSKDVSLREGLNVTLACSARGSPVPTIQWRREDAQMIRVNSTTVPHAPGPILKLITVTRSDMGAYLCIASNGVPPSVSKRIKVEVKFRPKVYAPHQLVAVPLGQSGTLECYIEAWPQGLNYWIRPKGYEILHNDEKYNVTSLPGTPSYKTHMILTIRNLTHEDIGAYNCVANNSQGGAEQVIRVSASAPIPNRPNSIEKRPSPKELDYEPPDINSVSWNSPTAEKESVKSSDYVKRTKYNKKSKELVENNEVIRKTYLYAQNFSNIHQIISGSTNIIPSIKSLCIGLIMLW